MLDSISYCLTCGVQFKCLLSGAFCCLGVSHDLCHEVAHRLSCLILFLPGGVGVGSQGEARIIVPQHTANGFYIYAILQC